MHLPHPHRSDAHHHMHSRRWAILALLGIAQLMVVLDTTIVNIALPSAQDSLGFSDGNRQWVITAYALAFGSLLLLGGRLGDLIGRKRVLLAGLAGFALASALGGAATSFGMLVAARGLQGLFAALLAPAALGLLTTTFTDPQERGKAFGIYGAIAGSGAAVGLLLGGVLTEWLDWRWTMYVNLVFAVPALFATFRLIRDIHPEVKPRVDIPGTLAAVVGLLALVYGLTRADTDGWGAPLTIVLLLAGIAVLGLFVLIQKRASHPLLPLRVVLDRNRGGAFMAMAISGAGIFGVFLFLTFYMQRILGFSPIQSGLAFLPLAGAVTFTAAIVSTKVLPRTGARPLMPTGMALAASGMILLTQVSVHSSYVPNVLPGLLMLGAAFGLIFAPGMATATLGVEDRDAGVASAMVNTMQQIGGSVGTALLSTIAASAASSYLSGRKVTDLVQAEAAVHGYTTAFWVAAGIFAVGVVTTAALLRSGVAEVDPNAAPVVAH